MASNRGKFITLEGMDGAGKSTHIQTIESILDATDIQHCTTREPGGTTLGERIREVLLHANDTPISYDAELLLMFAARTQHIEQVIQPNLSTGTWVICDRFTDATYAYQGGGRGIADGRIAAIEQWVQNELHPDLTLLFDLSLQTGLDRAEKRDKESDRFELENNEYKNRVRDYYLTAQKREPDRIKLIDAEQSLSGVTEQVEQTINTFIEYHV